MKMEDQARLVKHVVNKHLARHHIPSASDPAPDSAQTTQGGDGRRKE